MLNIRGGMAAKSNCHIAADGGGGHCTTFPAIVAVVVEVTSKIVSFLGD